jgi:ferrous iron transport protein B
MSSTTAGPRVDPLIALVGNPNCGKTALFNLLTGARQKVANYAGVTVERKQGQFTTPGGTRVQVLDLPGTYSLDGRTPDEAITTRVLRGEAAGETAPDLVVCVLDASNLRRSLRFALMVRQLGRPMVLALNMSDVARKRGLELDPRKLSHLVGVPVVETVAVRRDGARALAAAIDAQVQATLLPAAPAQLDLAAEVQHILGELDALNPAPDRASERIDRIVLHPVAGPLILAVVMFTVFQAVFAWAAPLQEAIKTAIEAIAAAVNGTLPESSLRSLLADGVIAGAGSVLVFLPQVLLLFLFILLLEDSGYLPRAAFLLDRLMGGVGLSGRSFIPLLSSFACAVPGIMATRTIPHARDRWLTIMIAPLMTCSARLPVYALLIGAFIPARPLWGLIELQGVVLFALYVAGIASAFAVAFVLKRTALRRQATPLLMELPAWHAPNLRHLAIGLLERAKVFLRRVGTIILALMIVLWAASTYPAPPADFAGPAIQYSFAGRLGALIAPLLEPIGFNWQIAIALVPGMAAREVAVGALGTVYALSDAGEGVADALGPIIAHAWGLPTALALLAWYVFAPQCLSTLVAVKRETGRLRDPLIMTAYLFALAWIAAFVTYRVALAAGL